MLYLLLLSGCFFGNLDCRVKGVREEVGRAIKGRDNKKLYALLNEPGAIQFVDEKNSEGLTPLYEAVLLGNERAVSMLLGKTDAIDVVARVGDKVLTALMCAAEMGHQKICELLLDSGCRADYKDSKGRTMLMHAASWGNEGMCKLLISNMRYNNVDSKDSNGETALMHAVKGKEQEKMADVLTDYSSSLASLYSRKNICKLLIEQGSAVDMVDHKGKTAFRHAVEMWITLLDNFCGWMTDFTYGNMYEFMKAVAGWDVRGIGFVQAARGEWESILQLLLSEGCNINAQDSEGETALMYAANALCTDACRLLLDMGADPNVRDFSDPKDARFTVLAAWRFLGSARGETVLMRLASKAQRFRSDESSREKFEELYRLLLDKGADPSMKNFSGESLIALLAKEEGSSWLAIPLSTYFMEKGLEIDEKAVLRLKKLNDHYTPHFAENAMLAGMFERFFDSYLDGAALMPPSFLLEDSIRIQRMNRFGFTGLHLAALRDDNEALRLMLGYDIILDFINDANNVEGLSPIRLALRHKKVGNAGLLLAHGALPTYKKLFSDYSLLEEEPRLKEFLKKDSLFFLLRRGRVTLAKRLITYSSDKMSYANLIDLQERDKRGMNVYHYLASYCNEDIAPQEFIERSKELKSFSRELLIQYDNEGFTPIHRAVLASNPYFIKHVASLGLISREELNSRTKNGDLSVLELVLHGFVDKDTVDAVIDNIVANCSSGTIDDMHKAMTGRDLELKIVKLEEFLKSGGDISAKAECGFSILEDIVAVDDSVLLSYVAREKGLNFEKVFNLALSLSSKKVLEFMCDTFVGYEAIRGEGPVNNAISKVNLHNLCAEGKEDSVRTVLRFKTNGLKEKNEDGEMPLHAAARKGRVSIVRILLEQKEVLEGINAVNNKKQSAIHCAVMGFSPETISILIENGCSLVLERDADEKRPIDLIVNMSSRDKEEESKRVGVIYALLCAADGIEYDPSDYESAINLAIKHDEVGIVKELLKEGYCNYKDNNGNTPLHIAVEKGNKEVVSAVLLCTKDFAVKNLEGRIPLHLVREVEIMREYFNKAMERDVESSSLLNGHVDLLRESALHSVVRRVNELGVERAGSLAKYMLDNGADRSKISEEGLTAEGLCMKMKLEGLANFIRDYDPDFSEMTERRRKREAELASEQLRKEARDVALILNGEMGVNELLSGRFRMAIHYAIDNRDSAKMEKLLDLGANPIIEDRDGNTAYRLAASMSAEIFENLLVKTGYRDLLEFDSKKETIVHIGLRKGGKFEQAVLKGLRAKGVQEPQLFFVAIDYRREEAIGEFFKLGFDVKVRDSQGKTALKHIIDSAGRAEARGLEEKDKLQRCFRCVLAGIKRSYDLASVLFSADDEWKTSMGAALSVSDSFYLLEILKRARAVLEEDEERTITKETFYRKLNSEIEGKIGELMDRPEHMIALLDSHSGMSNILVQGEESTFGKAIYLAAERKNEDAVRSMIASYVSFKSRKDIVYDKARGYIPMIVQPICVACGMGAVGKVVEGMFASELEEKYDPIRFIDEVYREGEWALDVEIIPVKDLLRYYKRAAKNLKEISREEVERKLAQSRGEIAGNTGRFKRAAKGIRASARNVKIAVRRAIKRELEKTDGSLLDVMFEVGELAILEEALRESYMTKRALMKSGILSSLDSYTIHHEEYEKCIEEDIRPVLKGKKDWNSEFGVILKELYAKLMKARRELKDKLYDYIEYTSHGYAVEVKGEKSSFV